MNSMKEINNMLTNLPPPPPPLLIIGDGTFDYVTSKHEKKMLTNAFQAITETNLWDFMAKDIYSYMFSSENEVKKIGNKMCELGYDLHSGASFGWVMRAMQFLAQNGESVFKEEYYGVKDN